MLRKRESMIQAFQLCLKKKLLNKQSKYTIFYDAFKSSNNVEWTQNTQGNREGVSQFQLAKKERKSSAMLE